ncbi:MAG: radical SAM protein [Proteobacteria bacterium]|nr:radical SAM protein [Pseudomonadota bacterium]
MPLGIKWDRRFKKVLNKAIKSVGGAPLPRRVPLFFIELTNICNLLCPMCPRSDSSDNRGVGNMDYELYKEIIDKIKAYGARYLNLNRFGESLIYPQFIDAIKYAKDQGIPNVGVVTNGTLLTKEMSEGIIDAGLDRIRISLDTLDPEDYAAGRVGGTLEKTLANIDYFFEYKKKKGSKIAAGINCVLIHDNFDQIQNVYERFKDICEVDLKPVAHYGITQNWKNIKKYEKYNKRACIQPWERLNFFYNGDVNICCGDVEGGLIVGNIKDKSIKELWLEGKSKEIRKKHVALDFEDLKVCQVCSGINADWYENSLKEQKEIYERLEPLKEVVGLSNTSPIVK